jgi:hypothetical protein
MFSNRNEMDVAQDANVMDMPRCFGGVMKLPNMKVKYFTRAKLNSS